jgi:site-specific recombinase XerD
MDEAEPAGEEVQGALVPVGAHPLVLQQAVPPDRHPAAVYLARLAVRSRRTMRYALDRLAGILSGGRLTAQELDWAQLRYPHTAAVRAHLQDTLAPATANLLLSALKGVLKEAWRLGTMEAEVYHRAVDVPLVRAQTLPKGRALTPGDVRALFYTCGDDPTEAGVRDAALLAVLYGVGVRRAEVVALDVADWDSDGRTLKVRRGKGRKDRMAHLPQGAVAPLMAWLELRGSAPGALFVPVRKDGVLQMRRMTDQAVLYILQKRARASDVETFSPHDLRRTFISDLLDAGADISAVQSLAGHANIQTTARYDRRGEAMRRKTADLLHIPYIDHRAKLRPDHREALHDSKT